VLSLGKKPKKWGFLRLIVEKTVENHGNEQGFNCKGICPPKIQARATVERPYFGMLFAINPLWRAKFSRNRRVFGKEQFSNNYQNFT
jgi:hypothetical protein